MHILLQRELRVKCIFDLAKLNSVEGYVGGRKFGKFILENVDFKEYKSVHEFHWDHNAKTKWWPARLHLWHLHQVKMMGTCILNRFVSWKNKCMTTGIMWCGKQHIITYWWWLLMIRDSLFVSSARRDVVGDLCILIVLQYK